MFGGSGTGRGFAATEIGDGQAKQEQGQKVGNEEGAPIVFGGETGKAEKVSEADGAAGDGEDDAEGGAPAVFFGGRHGEILSRATKDGEAFLWKMVDG